MYLNNQMIVLANSKINCHRSAQMQTNTGLLESFEVDDWVVKVSGQPRDILF